MISRTKIQPQKDQPFNPILYDDKCVSEICQCNQHKCPPSDVPNKHRIQQHNIHNQNLRKCKCKCKKVQKKCLCKCKDKYKKHKNTNIFQERHYDPSAIQTIYQVDFQGKYVQQDALKRTNGHGDAGIIHHGSSAPFLGNTEYGTQFTGKLVEKDVNHRNLQTVVVSQIRPPFDGTTTYNQSYQGKYVQRQNQISPKVVVQRPHVPFDGTSEYNAKYQYVALQDGGECQSCCSCADDQCSSCCDCQSVDSLDQINTNYKNNATTHYQTQTVYPQYHQQQVIYPSYDEAAFRKTQVQNVDCPVKKLPPVPKKCEPGKTHTKFIAKKNIWK